jgi:hypothetical protein
MKTFEIIEKYKFETITVIGFIGLSLIDETDKFNTLSGLIMLFGMFGMLAKTISPTVTILNVDTDEINKMIERKGKQNA